MKAKQEHIDFEQAYLAVRDKEQRVYNDEQVKLLPFESPVSSQDHEWQLRAKTTRRFLTYLSQHNFSNVLDLGCGNGWFTHQVAKQLPKATILGGDINEEELNQAKRCFTLSNVSFEYVDLFSFGTMQKFDLITINAAIQYFPDLALFMQKIKGLLSENGEFHILDSPVYKDEAAANEAQKRSEEYYAQLGAPEMSTSYFHHTWQDFQDFQIKYKPNSLLGINRILKQSPFPWLAFKRNE